MAEHLPNEIKVTPSSTVNTTIFSCTYKWVITNLTAATLDSSRVWKTSTFAIDGSSFFFQLVKRGNTARSFCELAFSSQIYQPSRFLAANFTWSFLGPNNVSLSTDNTGIKLYTTGYEMPLLTIPRADVMARIRGNTLAILFDFQLIKHNPNNANPQEPVRLLQDDIERLLLNGTYTDVVLKTPTKNFNCHKLILSSRSPVFAAMFRNDTRERNENTVDIADIKDDVLEELLKFIYTDETPRLPTMAVDLLIAADKYDVQALKTRCEKCLFGTVTIQNAGELLLTADLANAALLRTNMKRYIIRRRGEFVRTDKYQELRRSRPELILEIFEQPAVE